MTPIPIVFNGDSCLWRRADAFPHIGIDEILRATAVDDVHGLPEGEAEDAGLAVARRGGDMGRDHHVVATEQRVTHREWLW